MARRNPHTENTKERCYPLPDGTSLALKAGNPWLYRPVPYLPMTPDRIPVWAVHLEPEPLQFHSNHNESVKRPRIQTSPTTRPGSRLSSTLAPKTKAPEQRERERDEAAARDGVLVEPEPEHGGALAAQAAGLRCLLLRHGSPRQASGAFAPRAQCLRVRHPLQAHVRRPPPQRPRAVRKQRPLPPPPRIPSGLPLFGP